jgi:hypothetical protein
MTSLFLSFIAVACGICALAGIGSLHLVAGVGIICAALAAVVER